jgi:hypothetical protein
MRKASMFTNLHPKALKCALFLGTMLAASGVSQTVFAQSPPAMAGSVSAASQQTFANPDAAVNALVQAVQTDDKKSIVKILGPGGEKLVSSGDPVADAAAGKRFIDAYNVSHTLAPQPDGSIALIIGADSWPMPIPIVHAGNQWRFDATIGAQDIVDRRIGRNELLTIQTLLAAVAAEKDYFDRVKQGTGTGAYAERMISSPGTEDGLYWDVMEGEVPSPLGPLIEQAQDEGYPGATVKNGSQTPYHGYYFRILKGQGSDAPGGALDYIKDGKMTEGFALVAWPASYESTGIMSFVVDQDGIVFQKDLGSDTAAAISGMKLFNPDLSWARIEISN